MTNKTKAAIEEAVKLPTAEQLLSDTYKKYGWRYQPNIVGGCPHERIALEAIESHTTAHTAELREGIVLYKKAILSEQEIQRSLKEKNKALQERMKELENELKLSEDTIKHQAERCLKLEAENSIIHECLTELYNWHDNKVGDIVREYLDRIDDLAGRG